MAIGNSLIILIYLETLRLYNAFAYSMLLNTYRCLDEPNHIYNNSFLE